MRLILETWRYICFPTRHLLLSISFGVSTGSSGEYLEILSNHGDSDLISVEYRKVSTDCPDFDTVYRGIEQRLLVHFSNLKVVFNRAAMLYLNTYLQGLLMGSVVQIYFVLVRTKYLSF